MKYDVTIFGGGTSGCAAAYISAKYGLNTLLVEKTDVLGGAITQGLVIPCMKLDTKNINTEFYNDLLSASKKYNAQHTYIDGNDGWFSPELLKIVLDDMLSCVGCNVLFSTHPVDISYSNNFKINLEHRILSLHIETNYIVDSTSEGKIFKILNCDFQKKENKKQTPTLRFIMSGINIKKFADYIEKLDSDRNVTTVERTDEGIYLSTACTWDKSRNWALAPVFEDGVKNGIIDYYDTAYFQVFSVPGTLDSLAFNCPALFPDGDIEDAFVYSKTLKQARERIYRLYRFCVKFFPGFENAYISRISDTLGIRESVRIKGKYTLTQSDIINAEEFENIAFASDYPIDIHSDNNDGDTLAFINHTYTVPLESLISEKYDKLYAAGKILSADFKAQAAVRTQLNCFSSGEACAKDIIKRIKTIK